MKRTVILMALLCGCGAPPPTPVEQCNDFLEAVCTKQRICTSAPYSECLPALQATIPCGNAAGVGNLYEKCIGDLENKVCAELFPDGAFALPNDCKAVIKF